MVPPPRLQPAGSLPGPGAGAQGDRQSRPGPLRSVNAFMEQKGAGKKQRRGKKRQQILLCPPPALQFLGELSCIIQWDLIKCL